MGGLRSRQRAGAYSSHQVIKALESNKQALAYLIRSIHPTHELSRQKPAEARDTTGRLSWKSTDVEDPKMNNALLKLYVRIQALGNGEDGQDLVEYSLLVALIALACIAGVKHVATAVNTVFSNVSGSLA